MSYRLATRRDPFHVFDDVFQGLFPAERPQVQTWTPSLDVQETEDDYVVRLEVPGVDPDGLELTIHENTLVVKGEKAAAEEREGEKAHVVERRYGSFERSLRFPLPVEADQAQAETKHGVLSIRLPKRAEAKARQIEIKRGE